MTRVNKTVINNTYVNNSFTKNVNANRTSFNGPNGVKAQPNAEQKAAAANAKKQAANLAAACTSAGGKQRSKSPRFDEQGQTERRSDQIIQQE